MLAKVVVLEPSDFALWVKAQNNFDAETAFAGDITKLGEYYTSKGGCRLSFCRWYKRITNLKGLYGSDRALADGSSVNADDNYIRTSVLEPAKHVVQGYPAMVCRSP